MNSTDLWAHAWFSALPFWRAAVRQSGWHPVVAAAAYAAVALLCLAARRSAHTCGAHSRPWTAVAAAALLLFAMNTLFAFDLLFVELMRCVSRASAWYEARRGVQILVLVAAAAAGLAIWGALLHRLALAAPSDRWLLAGLSVLAGLAVLRAVSLHATDELVNARLAGLTFGRLLDALGLGLVASGAWCELRDPGTVRA